MIKTSFLRDEQQTNKQTKKKEKKGENILIIHQFHGSNNNHCSDYSALFMPLFMHFDNISHY